MFLELKAGLLAGLTMLFVAGCAYLPQGFPSRTSHAPVDDNLDDPADLFIDTGAVASIDNPGFDVLNKPPKQGLSIRKSKRGNMDSYVVRGQRYFTLDSSEGYSARGIASWYGPNFHGRVASNGEIYDMYRLTAAHKTLPLPTYARVTHLDNGKSIIVKINDRGPFAGDRLIDLSFAAALELGMVNDGTAMVEIKALSPEELFAMSGPDNTMGIDFYYDDSKPVRQKQKVAMDSLFYDDRTAAASGKVASGEVKSNVSQRQGSEAAVFNAEVPAVALPSDAVTDDIVNTANDLTASVLPVSTQGTPVIISGADPNFVEVVVPRREPTSIAEDREQEIFNGENVSLSEIAPETTSTIPDPSDVAGGVVIPVAAPGAVAASNANVIPAVAIAAGSDVSIPELESSLSDTKSMNLRYYLQAGVFARFSDAERLANNITREIPREEVHVKPLKNSAMYRVTVGPIVSKDHANEVSEMLQSAGIENYSVKVNES